MRYALESLVAKIEQVVLQRCGVGLGDDNAVPGKAVLPAGLAEFVKVAPCDAGL